MNLDERLVLLEGGDSYDRARKIERWLASEESDVSGTYDRYISGDRCVFWFSDKDAAFAVKMKFA